MGLNTSLLLKHFLNTRHLKRLNLKLNLFSADLARAIVQLVFGNVSLLTPFLLEISGEFHT